MRPELLHLASDLAKRGEPFALVTVVRRGAPSSARVGDMALVTHSGAFHGWVGGSCTQPTVVREALGALADRLPRLIALSPSPESDGRPGVAAFPMTCHSGGSVDIYIEPVLPAPRLVVFGASPVGRALARLGKALGYAVDAADPSADPTTFPEADRVFSQLEAAPLRQTSGTAGPWLCAVVATMGQWDEDGIRAALALEPEYLGVVASRTRFAGIRQTLQASGIAEETLAWIRNPAGLDIGAELVEEVALSVLAEIVRVRRTARPAILPVVGGGAADEALDPVCGMSVIIATARHQAEFGGRTYCFCCGGCRERFLSEPHRYLGVKPAEGAR
jgi:xanthine dehydrogenase accessory factor